MFRQQAVWAKNFFQIVHLGDFQECLTPFREIPPAPLQKGAGDFLGGQGGLKAETVMAEGSQSPLTPLLQRGGLVCSFLEYALAFGLGIRLACPLMIALLAAGIGYNGPVLVDKGLVVFCQYV